MFSIFEQIVLIINYRYVYVDKSQILREGLKVLNNFLIHEKNLAGDTPPFSLLDHDAEAQGLITIKHNSCNQIYTVFIQPWAPQKEINSLITQFQSTSANAIFFADFVFSSLPAEVK